jgi:hypothetical protein
MWRSFTEGVRAIAEETGVAELARDLSGLAKEAGSAALDAAGAVVDTGKEVYEAAGGHETVVSTAADMLGAGAVYEVVDMASALATDKGVTEHASDAVRRVRGQ